MLDTVDLDAKQVSHADKHFQVGICREGTETTDQGSFRIRCTPLIHPMLKVLAQLVHHLHLGPGLGET